MNIKALKVPDLKKLILLDPKKHTGSSFIRTSFAQ